MSIYRKFKTSKDQEQQGVWLDYGDGVEIRIARAGGSNKKFLKCAERFQRKYKRQLELEILPNDVAYDAAIQMYAESVVLEWKGVCGEDDQPLECTRENVVKVLSDLPDLFADIRAQATNHQLFKEYLDEQAAGN